MKQREQQVSGQQTPMSQQSNPFGNANGPIDISSEDLLMRCLYERNLERCCWLRRHLRSQQ